MKDVDIDTRENVAAMYIAILRDDVFTPEQAFRVLENKDIERHKVSDADVRDMFEMRKQGMTYREIGEIYGLHHSRVYRRIKNYEKRISQTAIWKDPI